jgi:hypothetical protein
MLSPRVDLTEHMDFSGGTINVMDTIIEIPLDEYQPMTCDEYEWFKWWESIFGRRGHRNQKYEIFNLKGTLNECKSHCYRCGKPFRIPWDNIGGVCRKCDSEMCDSEHNIPWKNYHAQSSRTRDIAYNLFNSK